MIPVGYTARGETLYRDEDPGKDHTMNQDQRQRAAERVGKSCMRDFGVRLKSVDEKARSVDVIMSTDAIDSYGDRVEQIWQLERYLSNPVVLFGHNSRELPIGRAKSVGVVDGALQCTILFATEKANPIAEQIFQLFKEEILRAVSVGFRPHSVRYEREDDEEICVLSDNELYELSVVPIPANAEALAKMAELGLIKSTAAIRSTENLSMLTAKEESDLRASEATAKAERDVAINASKTAETALTTERTKSGALQVQVDSLLAEKAAVAEKAEKALAVALDAEVEALVGKKIEPHQKTLFIDLAKSNRALFDNITKSLPALKVLEGPVVKPDLELDAATTGGQAASSASDSLVELALEQ